MHVAAHDEELVSTEPRNDVFSAHCVSDPVRNDPQDVVADEVAVSIVDLLELINIDEQHSNSIRVTCTARQRHVKLLHGDGPVREGSERVMQGLVFHPTRGGAYAW